MQCTTFVKAPTAIGVVDMPCYPLQIYFKYALSGTKLHLNFSKCYCIIGFVHGVRSLNTDAIEVHVKAVDIPCYFIFPNVCQI